MHNGVFGTIREVIEHYNNIHVSLSNYSISSERRITIPVELEIRNSTKELDEIFNSI